MLFYKSKAPLKQANGDKFKYFQFFLEKVKPFLIFTCIYI